MFNVIFQNILTTLVSHLETYVADCWDAIALFLCIHIILRYQVIAHQVTLNNSEIIQQIVQLTKNHIQREVPVLDAFYQKILSVLWPRMELVCQTNVQSVRACDVDKLGKLDLRPHIITRRYAEFCSAISVCGFDKNEYIF